MRQKANVVWLTSPEILTSKNICHAPNADMKYKSSLAHVTKRHQDALKHSSQTEESPLLPPFTFPPTSKPSTTSVNFSFQFTCISQSCQTFLAQSWLRPSSLEVWSPKKVLKKKKRCPSILGFH